MPVSFWCLAVIVLCIVRPTHDSCAQLNLAQVIHDFEHGHQRITADAKVLPPGTVPPTPQEFRDNAAYWSPWACRCFDAFDLAAKAYTVATAIIPEVQDLRQDPLAFSYRLATDLPLEGDVRQKLLECCTAADRLRMELDIIKNLERRGDLCCSSCGEHIAACRDVFAMSEEGTSGVFVNQHG